MESSSRRQNTESVRLHSFSHSSNSFSQFTTQRLTSEERDDIFMQIDALVSAAEADGPYVHSCLSLIAEIDSDRAGVAAAALDDRELLQWLVWLFQTKWVGMIRRYREMRREVRRLRQDIEGQTSVGQLPTGADSVPGAPA